jgi:LysM repeat protein
MQLSVRLLALLVGMVLVFLLIGGAAEADSPPAPTTSYVVAPGDTLWEIAGRLVEAGEDVRVMVAVIKELNGMADSTIYPGETLQVP